MALVTKATESRIISGRAALEFSKEEIDYAYRETKFFRKHMDDAGLAPGDIRTPLDFFRIPPTTKTHYRNNFPIGVLARGYSPQDPRLFRSQSSGTTEDRLVTLEAGILFFSRALKCLSVYPELQGPFTRVDRRIVRHAAPNCSSVECASPVSKMCDRILNDGTLVLSVSHDLMATSTEVLDQSIREIAEYNPQLYYVDPTHFAFLLRHMRRVDFTPPKSPIITTYTRSTSVSRRQLKEGFGPDVPVVELISMSEIGWIAMECPLQRLHINTESYLLELVAEGHRPAEPGEIGELLVTTLDKGCTPHIRYRTGDYYRLLSERCPCGHRFPIVEMEGRAKDFLRAPGQVPFTPKDVDVAVGNQRWIDVYSLVQNNDDSFTFYFVANSSFESGLERPLERKLRDRLPGATVTCERVQYIRSERSGKFGSCVSLLSRSS
jgi:phenylacetate-CoA ligase